VTERSIKTIKSRGKNLVPVFVNDLDITVTGFIRGDVGTPSRRIMMDHRTFGETFF